MHKSKNLRDSGLGSSNRLLSPDDLQQNRTSFKHYFDDDLNSEAPIKSKEVDFKFTKLAPELSDSQSGHQSVPVRKYT